MDTKSVFLFTILILSLFAPIGTQAQKKGISPGSFTAEFKRIANPGDEATNDEIPF